MQFRTISALALAAGLFAPTVHAQDASHQAIILGRAAFADHCAGCHGESGKGDGVFAPELSIPPRDLTKLAANAGGTFPFTDVYELIDGRRKARTHTFSMMPVWGNYFSSDVLTDRGISQMDADSIVQGRILSLVFYLQTLQE